MSVVYEQTLIDDRPIDWFPDERLWEIANNVAQSELETKKSHLSILIGGRPILFSKNEYIILRLLQSCEFPIPLRDLVDCFCVIRYGINGWIHQLQII